MLGFVTQVKTNVLFINTILSQVYIDSDVVGDVVAENSEVEVD